MDRFKNLLHGVEEELSRSQKTYDGQKRSELKDSDFLFPETKSFPIVTPADVKDAISNYGRMSGKMTYEAFLRKLYNMCKRKGSEFVAALPDASKEKLGMKIKSDMGVPQSPQSPESPQTPQVPELPENPKTTQDITVGSMVRNMDSSCAYYNSIGSVEGINTFPEPMGRVVSYKAVNSGKNWSVGQSIQKNIKHLAIATDFSTDDSRNTDYNNLSLMADDMEEMEPMDEDMNEFLSMALTALKSIAVHAKHLYNSVDDPKVVENLTEAWVLAKIAVMEDQMRVIRDYVVFAEDSDESEDAQSSKEPLKHPHHHKPKTPSHVPVGLYPMNSRTTVIVQPPQTNNNDELNENHNETQEENIPTETQMASKPGLWDNIRKKKEREGKKYKPAKPGDKDRPDSDQWKKLTK